MAYGGGRSSAFESQRFINCYPELATAPGAKNIAALVGTPGRRIWYRNPSPPQRAAMAFNGLLYSVISNKLFSISADGLTTTEIGTLQTSVGRVSMKNNGLAAAGIGGDQICIVDGTAGYIYNVTTATFSTITGGGFPSNPARVEFIDGYFVVIDGTMASWTSNLYDGTTWNALTKNPVQAAPDNIQALINLHQQLFFIKDYTTEVYYNTGTAVTTGSPFSRMQGAVIDYGTPAPWSVARGNNAVFFLANQRGDEGGQFVGVVMLDGYTPVVISPPTITYRMGQSSSHDQCFGYCYYDEGHTFYVLTNPVDDWTFVYDATTRMWHERSTSKLSSSAVGRVVDNSYVRFGDMHLVGDYSSGNLYEMHSNFHTDYGLPIVTEQITQHLSDDKDLDNVFIGQLQVDVEAGVGLTDVNSPAVALATVSGGAVTAINVSYNGADYTTAPLVILRGVGSGAAATAVVEFGSITRIDVTAGGAGYTEPPDVILAMPEVTPTAGLSVSNDGGQTWGNEYPRSMGKVGEYRKRLIWRGVGRARDRVFRLRISSPVKRVILGWHVDPA